MRVKIVFLTILFSSLFILFADPSSYNIDLINSHYTSASIINIEEGGYSWEGGQLIIQKTPSSENITMVVTSMSNEMKLTNVANPNYYFPVNLSIDFRGGELYTVDFSPSVIAIEIPDNATVIGDINLVYLSKEGGSDPRWKGTYEAAFKFQFFANDIELKNFEKVIRILAYYKERSDVLAQEVKFTNLVLSKNEAVDDLDVIEMHQTNASVTLGGLSFASNDGTSTTSYKIKILPGDESQGVFAFQKVGGESIVPYKLHIPSRTTPSSKGFFIDIPNIDSAGIWQDYIDLGVSNINYTNSNLTVGNYVSDIKIDLEVN
jgi:hypothetical protein